MSFTSSVIQLNAVLYGSEPAVWRRLEIDASLTLDQVHLVLQTAFDWRDAHLHRFTDEAPDGRMQGRALRRVPLSWGSPDLVDDGLAMRPETDVTLGEVLTATSGPLVYEYDSGDGWTHVLEYVESAPGRLEAAGAILLDGERRGPLEDSGGVGGYAEKLAILSDPTHPDHAEITEWVSWVSGPWRPFRPDEVAFDAINAELRALFPAALDRSVRAKQLGQRLLAKVPDGVRRDFRWYLESALAGGPHLVDDATAELMVRPYQWLIRRIGVEGFTLTAAGWMPGHVVNDAMRELGWESRWYGAMNRENQTMPVLDLRATATRFGLIRKVKGRLVLTVAAKACLDDTYALWRLLATGIAHARGAEAARDATGLFAVEVAAGRSVLWASESEPITYGLEAMGWRASDGWSAVPPEVAQDKSADAWRAFDFMNVFSQNDGLSVRNGEVTEGGRAFARAVLLSDVP